ncbi:methylated-DNA-[protein]-cysteine S-methyltransferase [Streptomyces sp. B4I13]|nr:methylated-DNA-[protein]-cysteine S-methyltransferase [Streptomyces sp. B4I13]
MTEPAAMSGSTDPTGLSEPTRLTHPTAPTDPSGPAVSTELTHSREPMYPVEPTHPMNSSPLLPPTPSGRPVETVETAETAGSAETVGNVENAEGPAGPTVNGPTYWAHVESPLGSLLLTADPDGVLTSLSVPGQKGGRTVQQDWRHDRGPFRSAEEQLAAYFAADLKEFQLPLRSAGTAFRERVWAALDSVPYGATTTYGEVAARLGVSRMAVRAVGGAVGANPLLIVRPCHRVIGADGSLTGYAGGLDRKMRLLTLEGSLRAQR